MTWPEGLTKFRSTLQQKGFSNSQVLQDVFALISTKYKKDGIAIDIGSSSPHQMYNNTTLLQKIGWTAFLADRQNHAKEWENYPNAHFFCLDCTKQESIELLFNKAGRKVDFLSLDIDDYTIDALKKINLKEYEISCITIEHNKYLGDRGLQRFEQREILSKHGYLLVVKNWHNFEDWWVNPKYIDIETVKHLASYSDTLFSPQIDLDHFAPGHLERIK